jgi:hypothetical protein
VEKVRVHVQREIGGAEIQHELSGHLVLGRRPVLGKRAHRRLDAPQTPDVGEHPGNGATRDSVELHGAELLGAPAVAIAAGCPPLLPQPAATNASTATASARAPVADRESPAAGKGNPDILTELSGNPLPERSREARRSTRQQERWPKAKYDPSGRL